MELSWVELQKLLEKVEGVVDPKVILIKRQHRRDETISYDFSIQSHYRYSDSTILTASVAGKENAKHKR